MALSAPRDRWWEALRAAMPAGVDIVHAEVSRDFSWQSAYAEMRLGIRLPNGAQGEVGFRVAEQLMTDPDTFALYVGDMVSRWVGPTQAVPARESEQTLSKHIVGFRLWKVGPNEELVPLFHARGGDWKGNKWVEAHGCVVHEAPAPGCHCGFNAFHEPAGALRQYAKEAKGGDIVLGAIQAKGRIEVHWEGFRCQWARPIAVVGRQLPGLAKLDSHEELVAFALDHGSAVPSDLRPERGQMYDPIDYFTISAPQRSYIAANYATYTTHAQPHGVIRGIV